MTDETVSVWTDIWAKTKATFGWLASWVAEYPTVAVAVILLLIIAALL
jgi:hypothetical protein